MTRRVKKFKVWGMACHGRILVADDDAGIREALRDDIAGLGCNVVAAYDGIDALEHLRRCSTAPCLVVLDLSMPRLDGEGVLRAIRADTSLCSLTVVSMTADRNRAPPLDVLAHLEKPFALSDLEAIIRRNCRQPGALLNSRRASR